MIDDDDDGDDMCKSLKSLSKGGMVIKPLGPLGIHMMGLPLLRLLMSLLLTKHDTNHNHHDLMISDDVNQDDCGSGGGDFGDHHDDLYFDRYTP